MPVLQHIEEGLACVEAELPKGPLRRRMTLARRADGSVVVHNAMMLDEAGMREVEAFGEPRFLVVPNAWHRLDAPAYLRRFPKLRVFCPRAAAGRVGKVVPVAGGYDDFPEDEAVTVEHIRGTAEREGVMRVRPAGVTSLVFNDLVFNMNHMSGFQGRMLRWMGSSGGPRVTPIGKFLLVRDAEEVSQHLLELSQLPMLSRLIIMHGDIVEEEASEVLLGVSNKLSRRGR